MSLFPSGIIKTCLGIGHYLTSKDYFFNVYADVFLVRRTLTQQEYKIRKGGGFSIIIDNLLVSTKW